MHKKREGGQAIILVLVSLSLFLIGIIGLAIDGAQLYAQRQMAQAAADAAAQAGALSIFSRTNTATTYNNAYGTGPVDCKSSPSITPCYYAAVNGFSPANGDTVHVDFPAAVPGVTNLAQSFTPAAVRVIIIRTVPTTLMQFVGAKSARVAAKATAALVDQPLPIPILVLHPSDPGTFAVSGGNGGNFCPYPPCRAIKICGGPTKSIQVNSSNTQSIIINGSNTVDLSNAGPSKTPGVCTGTGADFGDWGGPAKYPGSLLLGTRGKYVQPAQPVHDPFKDVPAPAPPAIKGASVAVLPGNNDCPANLPKTATCVLYSPGLFTGGITVNSNTYAIFQPGLYYLNGGGLHIKQLGIAQTAPSPCQATGTGDNDTGCGVVFYNTGNGGQDFFEVADNAGKLASNYTSPVCPGNCFQGPLPDNLRYQGITFFQDRNAKSQAHSLWAGGGLGVIGTIYLTNWETCAEGQTCTTMATAPKTFQSLQLGGRSGEETTIQGQIVVDELSRNGAPSITMLLDPGQKIVTQVALVE